MSTDIPKIDNRPSPADFDQYLPWACKQLQLPSIVRVEKVYQNEYISVAMTERLKRGKSRGKLAQSSLKVAMEQEKEEKSASTMRPLYDEDTINTIKIQVIYDVCGNLVQLKFDKNQNIPRILIKIVGLIIQFQSYINTIIINSGIDLFTVYEICKFLPASHITDVCFDGCCLKEPNYHLLLETANALRCISLSRCNIDDATVAAISSRLINPLPASKTLSILNLSSNMITDEGAAFLANALRSNRQLSYLNLASNMITDKGAAAIFNSLIEFPLTREEIVQAKARYMEYLKNKSELIAMTIRDIRIGDIDKRAAKRKSIRTPTTAVKKVKGESSQKSLVDPMKYMADMDSSMLDKALSIVEKILGNFDDPFSNANTVPKNGIMHCKGNNALCSLNMSYNSLSFLSLRRIQSVLLYQKLMDRKPRGLISISVEGNCIPIACMELWKIDDILEFNLTALTRRLSMYKKRPHTQKNTPR